MVLHCACGPAGSPWLTWKLGMSQTWSQQISLCLAVEQQQQEGLVWAAGLGQGLRGPGQASLTPVISLPLQPSTPWLRQWASREGGAQGQGTACGAAQG